jgi:hypothetical protein
LTGTYVVNLTAPPEATAMTFTPTNVRPDDGSVPTLGAAAHAAPATPEVATAPVTPATPPEGGAIPAPPA